LAEEEWRIVAMQPRARQPQSFVIGAPRARKKAAPEGAAKFREETPRKGHGISLGSVIPRCNNMAAENASAKQVPRRKLRKS
jgi:hypothetical protein